MTESLISKYNIPAPRYTSYPTVPYWDKEPMPSWEWKSLVKENFRKLLPQDGISLYIHLPYCESLCTYCGCNTRITVNHKVERPYIQTVLKEWQEYLNIFESAPRIKEIHLGGGTPTFFSPENLALLINAITSRAEIAEDAVFGFEAHPNSTSAQHLKILYDLGFRRLSLGIQDFDLKVQQIVNRVQSYETVEQVTRQAKEMGYTSVNFDIIYGLPLQTMQSIEEAIDKVSRLRPDRIAFYSYAHVPWIKPGQRKFTERDLPADREKRALYEEGRRLLELCGYAEIGMDHFALRTDDLYKAFLNKMLHRNFMGYTTEHTKMLIGLGASSISDVWNGFAQNIKTVESYTSYLDNRVLPLFKTHRLTEEDLALRRHILNIMCRMETSWKNFNEQTEALFRGLERMREMENDGLVVVGNEGLRVNESGRPFLRNICMALDARLWREQPEMKIFSAAI